MAAREVRDANKEYRDAKRAAKVQAIQQRTEALTDSSQGSPADNGANELENVSSSGGRVIIGGTELVSMAQYRNDMDKIRQGARKLREFGRREGVAWQKVRDVLRELQEGINDLDERYDRHGAAFDSMHTEASAYRDQTGMLLKAISAALSSLMKNINREDPANPYGLMAADFIRSLALDGQLTEVGYIVDILALGAEFLSYYDPAKGIASVFTQDYTVVRVPAGTIPSPAATSAGIVLT